MTIEKHVVHIVTRQCFICSLPHLVLYQLQLANGREWSQTCGQYVEDIFGNLVDRFVRFVFQFELGGPSLKVFRMAFSMDLS